MEPEPVVTSRAKAGRPPVYTPEQLLERLVQAAIALLDEQGGDAEISVAQIAARAKVSKRTVYTAIASKEELIAHVIRHNVAAVTEILEPPVTSAAAARATLARFLSEWTRMACGRIAVGLFVMAIRERSRYPAVGVAYQQTRSELGVQKLAGWLARMHAKQFLSVPDPALTSEFVLAMAVAEPQRKLALGLDAPMDDNERNRRVMAILQMALPER